MFVNFIDPLLVLTGLAAALVAGVFLTFSDFVMRALGASAPGAGAEAMQHVNREIFRSATMALFLGSVPLAGVVAILAVTLVNGPATGWMLLGATSYLVGVFLVTGLGNVPMNQRLDRVDHRSADGQAYWSLYLGRWTRLNHVRTICAVIAAASYLTAAMM